MAQSSVSPSESAPHAFEIIIIGFSFALLILCLFSAVTAGIGFLFTRFGVNMGTKDAAASPIRKGSGSMGSRRAEVASKDANAQQLDQNPELLAVITAAVHAVYADASCRVAAIREETADHEKHRSGG